MFKVGINTGEYYDIDGQKLKRRNAILSHDLFMAKAGIAWFR